MKSFSKFYLSLILITGLIAGCDEVDKLLTFTITDETDFTIETASPLNIPLPISTPDITTNSSQEFQNNNTRADLVKDVRLEQLKLTITDPQNKTFSFLKSIRIFISTNQNDEIELAHLDNIASPSNTLELETTDAKLDTYAKASSYKLRVEAVTKETLNEDVDIRSTLKFKVTADPI